MPGIRTAIAIVIGLAAMLQSSGGICAQLRMPFLSPGNGQTSTDPQAPTGEFESMAGRQLGNVPDDVGFLLQEAEGRIDSIFPFDPLQPLHELWDCTNNCLQDKIGLEIGLNYTSIYQRADTVRRGPREASSDDIDLFGRWSLCDSDCLGPGAFVFSTEQRTRYTEIPPSMLNTGAQGGTIVAFNTQHFSVVQAYWDQGSFEDGFEFRIGKMDPALIWDGGRYVSMNYAFLSPAFSDTQPMALPGAGLGVAGAVYLTECTYITAGVHDANGKRTTAGFDTFFEEGEFFTATEFGWFPNEGESHEGLYHVTLWHVDSRENAGKKNDRGVAVTLEQQVGCHGNVVPFLRYAYAHRGINGIRQNLSIGMGIEDVFGQNDDVIGAAWSWQDTTKDMLRDQYVVETFYRINITPHTHLTPDIQVVIDPANAPKKDAVTVFGLRLRTLF